MEPNESVRKANWWRQLIDPDALQDEKITKLVHNWRWTSLQDIWRSWIDWAPSLSTAEIQAVTDTESHRTMITPTHLTLLGSSPGRWTAAVFNPSVVFPSGRPAVSETTSTFQTQSARYSLACSWITFLIIAALSATPDPVFKCCLPRSDYSIFMNFLGWFILLSFSWARYK